MEWLEGGLGLAVYLVLKLGGYAVWSYVGVRWLGRSTKPVLVALMLGVARLVMGWMTGLVVAPVALVAVSTDHVPVFYFTALVVVRWFEWGAIQVLIPGRLGPGVGFLTGGSRRGRIWRAVGVGVSYLADAPFLLTEGFPHGRIFC
jgi:hypothetical protein